VEIRMHREMPRNCSESQAKKVKKDNNFTLSKL
jgi:hypothetical protein